MRDQLIPLLGQLVLVRGYLKEINRNVDGDRHDNLLMAADVRPVRFDVALSKVPAVKLHHVWVRCGHNDPCIEMLRHYETTGIVTDYTRANGTADLGIEHVKGFALENLFRCAMDLEGMQARHDFLHRHLTDIANGGVFYCWERPAAVVLRELQAIRDNLKRSVDANKKALLSSKPRGKAHRTKSVVKLRSRKLEPSRGF